MVMYARAVLASLIDDEPARGRVWQSCAAF